MEERLIDPQKRQSAVDCAQRWLARFAPLLDRDPLASVAVLKQQLTVAETLKRESGRTVAELSAWATDDDQTLLLTLREAVAQLDSLTEGVRRRVGELTPGDPAGTVNLAALRAKLAESAARTELGETSTIPERVELLLSGGNLAAAALLAGFSLFWNGFTLVHAVMFIGGFWQVIGAFALFFLLFYSLFFGAGFAMAKQALDSASKESLLLEERTLLIRKTLGGWVREKRIELGPESRVGLDLPTVRAKGSRAMALTINAADGKQHQFGVGLPEHLKSDYVKKLNYYLAATAR